MTFTGFLSLRVRRWIPLLGITFGIQLLAAMIAPQYVCACPGPYPEVLAISLIPIPWAVLILAVYKDAPERTLGWGAFAIAVAFVYLCNA